MENSQVSDHLWASDKVSDLLDRLLLRAADAFENYAQELRDAAEER
ncbi:hypothetical protein [Aquabacterium sp.]